MSRNSILIIAVSGRMLAQSARRAGLLPLVIDRFGDRDTRALAGSVSVVSNFQEAQLSPLIEHYRKCFGVCDVVYGSGLETHPQSLRLLEERFNLLGNTCATLSKLRDKQQFFHTLSELNILYPAVSFAALVNDDGVWLKKPQAGEGGLGITWAEDNAEPSANEYMQRYVVGTPMSLLFLADGRQVKILGLNRQWTAPNSFVFGGIINHAELPLARKSLLVQWLVALVVAYDLKGLNSLDFIWDGMQCWILEINPRPPASMLLYDEEYTLGLLYEHINACCGKIGIRGGKKKKISASHIIYATRFIKIPINFQWPEWSMDWPSGGSLIRAAQPICSIIARGDNPHEVDHVLRTRLQIMINLLER